MTLVQRTIDDISPLVMQSGSWSGSDAYLDSAEPVPTSVYYGGTISSTNQQGALLSFDFNGTAISLWGSKGPLHCEFNVTIDGVLVARGNSSSPTQSYQDEIYTNSSLPAGLHNIQYINDHTLANGTVIDLDFITVSNSIGAANATFQETRIDNSNLTAWTFSPSGSAWFQDPPNLSQYTNISSVTATQQGGAKAVLLFEVRDAITVYGASSQINGEYTVSIDSIMNSNVYNAQHDEVSEEVVLYYADNLGPGQHSLALVNQPSVSSADQLWIEAAVAMTAVENAINTGSETGTGTGTSPSASNSSPSGTDRLSSSKSSTVVIAGAAAAGSVVLIVIVAIVIFVLRRRRQRSRRQERLSILTPGTIDDVRQPVVFENDSKPVSRFNRIRSITSTPFTHPNATAVDSYPSYADQPLDNNSSDLLLDGPGGSHRAQYQLQQSRSNVMTTSKGDGRIQTQMMYAPPPYTDSDVDANH